MHALISVSTGLASVISKSPGGNSIVKSPLGLTRNFKPSCLL